MSAAKQTKLLESLAEKSPQGFAWAREYLSASAKTGVSLDDFLKSKNVPYVTYIQELAKATHAPGDVLAAMRDQPAVLARVGEKITVSTTLVPQMPKPTSSGEQALATLAAKDPKTFAVAKAYSETPAGTHLGAFLSKLGMTEAQFIQDVSKACGAASGDILKVMNGARDFAEGVTKFISHTKLGRAISAGGVLLGALTGANASTLPEAGKSFAIAAAGAVDPTALVGPSIAENAVAHAFGRKSEMDEMGIDTTKIAIKTGVLKAQEINSRIGREQTFLFDPNHPGQLGALAMKDDKGVAIDVAAALRDPAKRGQVMSEIERRIGSAESPSMKDLYQDMKTAATDFVALEDRRRPMPAGIVVAEQTQGGAAKPAAALGARS